MRPASPALPGEHAALDRHPHNSKSAGGSMARCGQTNSALRPRAAHGCEVARRDALVLRQPWPAVPGCPPGAVPQVIYRRSPTRVHTSEHPRMPHNNHAEHVQLCCFSHTVEALIYLGIICFLPWSSLYSEQLLSFNKPLVKAFSLL